jgi:non-homologous end joining protein Ku
LEIGVETLGPMGKPSAVPRSIWNGTVSVGLIAVPVKVHSAVEDKSVHFHQVHAKDGARIKQKRICSKEGKEVPYKEVVGGYELRGGEYVLLSDDEIKAAAGKSSHLIGLDQFVCAAGIDPVFYERTYYLGAGDDGHDAYRLLHDALKRSRRAGLGRWVFHNQYRERGPGDDQAEGGRRGDRAAGGGGTGRARRSDGRARGEPKGLAGAVQRWCSQEDVEVDYEEITHSYELENGDEVIVSDQELEAIEPRRTRTIDIEQFVELDDVDPIYFDHPYFLVPSSDDDGAMRAYRLLRDVMADTDRAALGRFVMRAKEYLAIVRVRGQALTLTTMRFADEVRPVDDVDAARQKSHAPTRKQLDAAVAVIEELSRPTGILTSTRTAIAPACDASSTASARATR